MHVPVISIILPVYNAKRYLEPCLDSILNQSFVDFELLVGDDGSVDNSLAVLERYSKRDARIKVFSFEHRGVVKTLNGLIQESKGKYIARHDADDISHEWRLALLVAEFEKSSDVDVLSSQVELFSTECSPGAGHQRYVRWINRILTPKEHYANRFAEQPLANPSAMVRREVFYKHGLYCEDPNQPFPEDYDFWLRLLERGVQMKKLPERLYYWRDSKARLTRSHPAYTIQAFYHLKMIYLIRYLEGKKKNIYLWGAGRVTRKRFMPLIQSNLNLKGFFDISPKLIGNTLNGKKVFDIQTIESLSPDKDLIIVGVGGYGVREQIANVLERNGFFPSEGYYLCSH